MVMRLTVTVAAALGIAAPTAPAQELRVYTLAGGGAAYELRDGMRATGAYLSPTDATVRPDGTFLVATQQFIWRVDGRGRLERVMGLPRPADRDGDGGPAREASLQGSAELATAPDGGTLIADSSACGVRRIAPDGTVTRVAGRRPPDSTRPCWTYPTPATEIGDEGPATEALIASPSSISATPVGGFLIADATQHRIRRVDASGTIRTVAGRGPAATAPSPAPYSGAATEAALASPTAVASLAGGGFIFVDSQGIHEVEPAGGIHTLHTAVPPGRPGLGMLGSSETGLPFGTFVTRNGESRQRFRVFGHGLDLAFGADQGFFVGDGEPLSRANVDPLVDVERLPEGGLLLVQGDRVRAALPEASKRLAVAIGRESLRSLAHRRLAVRLTMPAALSVEIYSGRKPVRRIAARGRPGLALLRVPRAVPTDLYRVRVIATGKGGTTASSRLRVIVGPGLPLRAAELAATDAYERPFARAADQYPYAVTRRCHRFTRARIDCIVGEEDAAPDIYCIYVSAVSRAHNGVVYTRSYGCPRRRHNGFKRAPRWTGKRVAAMPF